MIVKEESIETLRGRAGIYQFVSPSRGVYIGSAACLMKRLRQHHVKSTNVHLRRSIAKYGFAAHEVSVVEFVNIEGLTAYAARKVILSAEQRWIDAGFAAHGEKMMNVCPTAGSTLGRKHSDEARQRMSAAQSRPEVKARKSAAQKEAQNRPEVKARHSAAAKEAQSRPEVKARYSAAQKESQSRPEIWASRGANVHVEGHGTFRSVLSAFDSLGIHERGAGFGVHQKFRAALKKSGTLTYTEPNGTNWHFSVVLST
jgi:group I intron endonuclease